MNPVLMHVYTNSNSIVKYYWKYTQLVTQSNIIFITEATNVTNTGQYESVALILTLDALIITNSDQDKISRILSIAEVKGIEYSADPTLLCLKLSLPKSEPKIDDEVFVEMDPVSRARVADYVRNTTNLVQIPEDFNDESDRSMSISPDLLDKNVEECVEEQTTLTFYVKPQNRNHFICLLSQARKQTQNYNFPMF